MIVTDHAKKRLLERYSGYGLDYEYTIEALSELKIENANNYEIVIIDGIPIVLICNKNTICTIYPHPLDLAVQSKEYLKKNIALLNTNEKLFFSIKKKESYIRSLETKVKNLTGKIKRSYHK